MEGNLSANEGIHLQKTHHIGGFLRPPMGASDYPIDN